MTLTGKDSLKPNDRVNRALSRALSFILASFLVFAACVPAYASELPGDIIEEEVTAEETANEMRSASPTKVTVSQAMSWCESKLNKTVGTGQCVALIQAYYKYLGVSAVSGNGCDYATNSLPSGWTRKKGGVPAKGDILVYTGAKYGHVAIYAGGTTSYHQNMSGKYVEKKTNWNYDKSWYSNAEGGTKSYWGYIRPNWPASKPAVPAIKSWSSGGMDSVTIKWGEVSGATSYTIRRRKKIAGILSEYTTIKTGVTGTSFKDSGLETASIYYYSMKAENSAGSSAWSGSFRTWTRSKAPKVEALSSKSVRVTWDPIEFAGTYRIDRRIAQDGTKYSTIKTGLTATSFTDTGVSPDTPYYYRVYPVGTDDIDNITVQSETSKKVQTPASYHLDLNGYLGTLADVNSISGYGTVDVYINGKLDADDVSDYYKALDAGTTYEIKDIKAESGKHYYGVTKGSLTGTMSANTAVYLHYGTMWTGGTQSVRDGKYMIALSTDRNKVLSVEGGSTENKANLQLGTKNGTAGQTFEIKYLGNGYYGLIDTNSGNWVHVKGSGTTNGTNVHMWNAKGFNGYWVISSAGGGLYNLITYGSSMYMEAAGGSTADRTNIQISSASGSGAQKFELIPVTVYVSGVSLDASAKEMEPGETGVLKATVSPSNATDKSVIWSSEDSTVVSVDESGNIKALKEGSSVITAETKDGGKKAFCTVTVKKAAITRQPESTSAATGETVSLHVEAEGKELAYRWQWQASGGTAWKDCTSAGHDTDTFRFAMKDSLDGRKYRCVVTGRWETLVSEEAEITLKVTGPDFRITEDPEDVEACIGERVELHTAAAGTGLSYQWQWMSAEVTSWKNCTSSGCDTDTFVFTMKEALDGRLYRCVVSNGSGTLTTGIAAISLKEAPAVTITSQPNDVSAALGETVTLTVKATEENLTYRWQWRTAGGTVWKNCTSAGSDTDTFTFIMKAALDGRLYRCVITDGNGGTAASDEAELALIVQAESNAAMSAAPVMREEVPAEAEVAAEAEKAPKPEESDRETEETAVKETAPGTEGAQKETEEPVAETRGDLETSAEEETTEGEAESEDAEEPEEDAETEGAEVPGEEAEHEGAAALVEEAEPEEAVVEPAVNGAPYISRHEDRDYTVLIDAEREGLTYRWQFRLDGNSEWTDLERKTAEGVFEELSETDEPEISFRKTDERRAGLRCIVTDADENEHISEEILID